MTDTGPQQDEWWEPDHGPAVRLVDMTPSHRRNLLAFLRRPVIDEGDGPTDPDYDEDTPFMRRLAALVAADENGEA